MTDVDLREPHKIRFWLQRDDHEDFSVDVDIVEGELFLEEASNRLPADISGKERMETLCQETQEWFMSRYGARLNLSQAWIVLNRISDAFRSFKKKLDAERESDIGSEPTPGSSQTPTSKSLSENSQEPRPSKNSSGAERSLP